MIRRIFHPVGQGAFYSESHENNINIVYDCGTEYRNKKSKTGVVTQSFRKDDVIQILFISHFDYDHISLIDILKNTVEIKKVVIPLLHEGEKIALSEIYKESGESSLATLVSNPNDFFGEKTRVITVQPYSEDRRESINLDTNKTIKNILSRTSITINNLSDWIFVPFNYENEERKNEFLNKLSENNIDIEKIKNDPEYALDKKLREKIKMIYKHISGGINQNSMFLYSGPSSTTRRFFREMEKCFHHFCCVRPYSCCRFFATDRIACLYTGDGDLNKVDVRKIYSAYWDFIGTIQIPHHGSLSSFDKDILYNGDFFLCPISVGKNNSYGHPSVGVISEILSRDSYPVLITEDTDSTFVEIIEEINH